jgi:hypothetical protein
MEALEVGCDRHNSDALPGWLLLKYLQKPIGIQSRIVGCAKLACRLVCQRAKLSKAYQRSLLQFGSEQA